MPGDKVSDIVVAIALRDLTSTRPDCRAYIAAPAYIDCLDVAVFRGDEVFVERRAVHVVFALAHETAGGVEVGGALRLETVQRRLAPG